MFSCKMLYDFFKYFKPHNYTDISCLLQMRGDSYEGGCMGTRGARVWIFLGFVMGFAAVIASCSILLTVYINRGKNVLSHMCAPV